MNSRTIANPIWLNDSSGFEIQIRTLVATNINVDVQIFSDLPDEHDPTDPLSQTSPPTAFADFDAYRIKPLHFFIGSASITADGSLNSFFLPVKRGNLVNVAISAEAASLRHGDCYIVVNLRTFPNSNAPIFGTILRGYVTSFSPIFYPGSPMEDSSAGAGSHIIYNPPNPAAGNNLVVVIPANQIWKIRTIDFQLVTSAAVANRVMSGYYRQTGGGNRFVAWGVPASVVQAASLTFQYTGSINYGPIAYAFSTNDIGTTEPFVLPDVILYPNESFETIIASIQGADQIQTIYMSVERWVSP